MKKTIVTTLILSALLFGSCVWAGEFENGVAAYNRKDYATALMSFGDLALNGNAVAQAYLGTMYVRGQGIPQDYAEALKLYRLSAAQGYALGQFNLGVMYANGLGIPQDYAEALKLYRLAAAQGIAGAQKNLGVMYYYGQGVAQDYVHGHMWANIAAMGGEPYAIKNRDIFASRMTREQIAEAQKMARDCLANNFKGCD